MPFNPDYNLNDGDLVKITRPDGSVIFIRIINVSETDGVTDTLNLDISNYHNSTFVVNWHNCYSFGNGVESNRIRDAFNKPFIKSGVTVSTVFEDYKQEHLKNGLIYSGLYNSISNTNNLNQFIQAEKITKNINPTYGSIQKLHTRDTDLITLCEDKIIKILANKDAVYNADGNPQLTANENVLGQAVPFIGEYGISKNPESFASESYRTYFTDKARGAVLRLSKDGLTAISDHGMKNWFRDNLKLGGDLIGSYDDKKDEYNLTIKNIKQSIDGLPVTVSFKENVTGWVSFKSFVPENAVSCNSDYYTFHQGRLWLHHQKEDANDAIVNRNTFYNTYTPSSITVLLNDSPGIVKTFNTLNYEGSQSKINELITYDTYTPGTSSVTGTYNNPDYYNLTSKSGWYVEHIITDQEKGSLNEFIEKEGKWFNYIRGKTGTTINIDGTLVDLESFNTSYSSLQGLGMLMSAPVISSSFGCTDPHAFNYNPAAALDDGMCVPFIYGCNDPTASNYDVNANTDDGSCYWLGCTDPTAMNYDPIATQDDNSCIATVYGCTDSTMFNYSSSANVQCNGTNYGCFPPNCNGPGSNGCCEQIIYGCTDPAAYNPCTNGCNTDDGSCVAWTYGCMIDPTACNYNPSANIDDGSCTDCSITGADNYGGTYGLCGSEIGCQFCENVIDGALGWQSFGSWNNPQNFEQSFTVNNIVWDGMQLQWDEGTIASSFWPAHHGVSFTNVAQIDHFKIITYWEDGGVGQTTTTIVNQGNLSSGVMNSGGTLTYDVSNLQENKLYKFFVYPECIGGTIGADSMILPHVEQGLFYTHQATTPQNLTPGCTCDAACNFNPSATQEDGSCDFSCYGCTDPNFVEYDPNATMQWPQPSTHGNAQYPGEVWCAYIDGGNVWGNLPGAIACGVPGGTGQGCNTPGCNDCCMTPVITGCMDSSAFNYDPAANTACSSCCIAVVTGCMDDTLTWDGNTFAATNYNPLANTSDGSCVYASPTMNFSDHVKPATSTEPASPSGLLNITVDFSQTSSQISNAIIWGFIGLNNGTSSGDYYQFYNNQQNSITATNYNAWGGTNSWPDASNNPQSGNVDTHNLDITESGAAAYIRTSLIANHATGEPEGTVWIYAIDNNASSFPNHGITVGGTGYQSTPTVNNVLGTPSIFIRYGCLDTTAATYDATANVHYSPDCVWVHGCMDSTALNYDSLASTDDGSCTFANQFDGSTVNNETWNWNASTSNNGSKWEIGIGAPNIKQGINEINGFNYSLTNSTGDKDRYIVWVRFTNASGTTYVNNTFTSANGWIRLTKFSPLPWYGNSYAHRSVNTGVFYMGNTPSYDDISFQCIKDHAYSGNTQQHGWDFDDTGQYIEIAVFPIIDRTKLDTNHPEYATTNNNGNHLTVPAGADIQGGYGPTLGEPPIFPTNVYTLTISSSSNV
tara:strand:+ start:2583 stop:6860 length:4278 start_codon:yes stop_codon:yes gene_type:complete